MTEQSADIAELAKALALAQAEIKSAKKDSKNPYFDSTYADLESVREASMPFLTKQGIAVVQLPVSEPGTKRSGVSTTLLHSSGQWIRGTIYGEPEKATAQGIGSLITYLRRYALAAASSVAPADDDGNAASGKGAPANGTAAPKPKPPKANTVAHDGVMASHKQVAYLHMLKSAIGGLTEDLYRKQLAAFKDANGKPVTSSKDLSESQISNLIERYEAKKAQQEARASEVPDLEAAFSQAEENARLRETIGPVVDR